MAFALVIAALVALLLMSLALGRTARDVDRCGHDPDCEMRS